MRVWFESFDGKMFKSQMECEAHEEAISSFKMFNDKTVAENTDEALVVYLPETSSAKAFITRCVEEGSDYEGIEDDYTGLFVWDDGEERYNYVSDRCIEAIKVYLDNR